MSEKKIPSTIIIAPHPDDEIIGCYEVLMTSNPIILYDADIDLNRKNEALELKKHVKIKAQFFHKDIPISFLTPNTKLYAPDPFFEVHPEHRRWGFIAEQLARKGVDVIFYNTIMNAPYIHETKMKEKEDLLNKVYPSQNSLWKYEKKYVIYEGYCKWIF